MLPLRLAARTEVGDRDREAPSVRPSRAPARGYATSGLDLPLRALPRRDEGGVSRGSGLAHSIWRAHQGRGDLSQYPPTHSPPSNPPSSTPPFRPPAHPP